MLPWAGIVRVSHMGDRRQGADNFHADREQVNAIRGYADRHNATLEILPAELDTSGGLPLESRPSLLAAVEGAEAGVYEAVIVAYLSRFGRSLREQLRAWDRIEAAGARVIVVQEGIDTRTPSGRLHRNVLLSIAEHEREQHAERFDDLRRWATDAGIWQRRQTPKGYTRNPRTRKLERDAEAVEVRSAFEDRGRGVPIVQIARRLGMTPSGTRQLLRNRVYLGELHVGGYANVTAHDPVVDVGVFEAAQTTVPRPPRGKSGPALLAGLVRCAGCGHAMSRSRAKVLVYSCQVNHSGERCPAPATVTARLLDEHVERLAVAELAGLEVAAAAGVDVEGARRDLDAAEIELAAYVRMTSAAGLGEAAFVEGARQRQRAVDGARGGLRDELARRPLAPVLRGGVQAYESLSVHGRNRVLRGLLSCVVVARAGGRGARVRLADRVRVLVAGADVGLPVRGGGVASGVVSIDLAGLDGPDVLREVDGEAGT